METVVPIRSPRGSRWKPDLRTSIDRPNPVLGVGKPEPDELGQDPRPQEHAAEDGEMLVVGIPHTGSGQVRRVVAPGVHEVVQIDDGHQAARGSSWDPTREGVVGVGACGLIDVPRLSVRGVRCLGDVGQREEHYMGAARRDDADGLVQQEGVKGVPRRLTDGRPVTVEESVGDLPSPQLDRYDIGVELVDVTFPDGRCQSLQPCAGLVVLSSKCTVSSQSRSQPRNP
jgi:hypothetical protein